MTSERFDDRGIPYDGEDKWWYIYLYDENDEKYCDGRLGCIQCGTKLHRENIMTVTLQPNKPLDPWEDPNDLPFARIAEVAGVVEYVCFDCFTEIRERDTDG